MRSPGLVVMAAAGLLVVGYAFYTLLSPPERSGAARSRSEAAREAGDEADDDEAPKAGPRAGKRDPAARKLPVDTAPRQPVPPLPQPKPDVSVAEARKQFADYMAELDGIKARDQELTSPEWVELYKRGHDVLQPLQRHLDPKDPGQAQELRTANEDMRAKLNDIEPSRRAAAATP
jgi:hypothetical protein